VTGITLYSKASPGVATGQLYLTQSAHTAADTTLTASLPADSPPTDVNYVRPVNSNIRAPRGIPPPQREIPPREVTVTSSDSHSADDSDTNPLRRLRNVNTFRPVTMSAAQRYK